MDFIALYQKYEVFLPDDIASIECLLILHFIVIDPTKNNTLLTYYILVWGELEAGEVAVNETIFKKYFLEKYLFTVQHNISVITPMKTAPFLLNK